METNNFEKQIQQKLDELKIGPSDSVWTNVEKQIREKKKKRKYAILFFFLFLILASGSFWLINSVTQKPRKSETVASVLKKSSKATNKTDSSFHHGVIKNNVSTKSDSAGIATEKSNIQNVSDRKNITVTQGKIHSLEIKIKDSKPKNNKKDYFVSENKSNTGEELSENFISSIKVENINIKKEKATLQKENKLAILQDQSLLQKNQNETSFADSIIKKHSKKIVEHPWNFGITFSSGNSFTTKNRSSSNNVYSDPSGNISNGVVPGYYYTPSELKNSTAVIAGVFAERNIFDENKISVGISYQYFSLENKVGNAIIPSTSNTQYLSSSNNLYGSINANHSYRNQFHFLEVPVSISFRINKSNRVPLFWNAGINISELISSNALQFQPNPGIYYKDNSLFNKTQFGLNTGFSFTFFSKEKYPLSIGPYFLYNASKLANEGLYGKKHFNFIGIKTEILFGKK